MIVTRHVGNCQLCEGDQKLHEGRMVHHGYKRPGTGFIEGDCPGVAEVPYEVSCDLVKQHIVNLRSYVAERQGRLDALRDGTVTELYVKEYRPSNSVHDGRHEIVLLVAGTPEANKYDVNCGGTKWQSALRSAISNAEADIRHAKSDIAHCTRRVADWKPMPVRTVEEEQAKADAGKAARKAVKDAAMAEKLAKQAATMAKQKALEAKRRAIREGFEAQLRTLAGGDAALADRQHAARRLLAELDKTKYRHWLGRWDLRCEEAIVALGLSPACASRQVSPRSTR